MCGHICCYKGYNDTTGTKHSLTLWYENQSGKCYETWINWKEEKTWLSERNTIKAKSSQQISMQSRNAAYPHRSEMCFCQWMLTDPSCAPIHICTERKPEIKCVHVCLWPVPPVEWKRRGLDKWHFVSAAPRLKQILKAFNIWRLASPATLTADTFHATAVNSSSGVYITNSWRTCAWLAGGGRDVCLLCKGSSLPLLYFFLPPPPPSHFQLTHGSSRSHHLTTPSTPARNHLLPHDKHEHIAVTPQENALTSWGCTVHLIRGKHQQLFVGAKCIWLIHQNKNF